MTPQQLIFVGFELTEEIQESFSDCSERDRVYLEDPSYLESITIGERKYIGKRAKTGIAIDRLEDMARNVVSLLARVSNNWTQKANNALVIAVEEYEQEPDAIPDHDDKAQEDSFDYSELVD